MEQRVDEAESALWRFDSARAARLFEGLAEEFPARHEFGARRVEALIAAGDFDEAVEVLNSLLKTAAGDAHVRVALGNVYFRKGEFEKAEEAFTKAIELDGKNALARVRLGKLYTTQHDGLRARAQYEKAYELAPDDAAVRRAWMALAEPWSEEWLRRYRSWGELGGPQEEIEELVRVVEGLDRPPTCRPDPLEGSIELPLRAIQRGSGHFSGQYGTMVRVNGKKKRVLLVDTGASGLPVLDRQFVEASGGRPVGELEIVGIGEEGARKAQWAWVDSLGFGDLVYRDCLVIVADLKAWGFASGIFDPGLFNDFLVTLDFPERTVELEANGTPGRRLFDQDRDPAPTGFFEYRHISSYDPLLETIVNERLRLNFLIDTGASETFLSEKLAREIGGLRESAVTVRGISGEDRNVFEVPDVVTNFAGLTQRHEWTRSLDLQHLSTLVGSEIGGILGMSTLEHLRVTLDYHNGYVRLENKK